MTGFDQDAYDRSVVTSAEEIIEHASESDIERYNENGDTAWFDHGIFEEADATAESMDWSEMLGFLDAYDVTDVEIGLFSRNETIYDAVDEAVFTQTRYEIEAEIDRQWRDE